ncbi:MAG: hypothetical protein NWT08_14640 [Akkermansiaceae bacterium]|jgi:hypothetical protein|nr:hypothetical protein [Akkermansiaceae bacterium]MDP4646656.1 hypothetical protein [Akkermansiaceae bacterium]MDP4721134.1 hypothetical protein [Akkermansiaceae bacterium]MDP4779572.1 hypothetical protein [Akkermansiaceae bacterium]MDP4846348.1 hypothetical protein [Akkermansiaceae bacterium]
MMRPITYFAAAALALFLPACADKEPEEKPKEKKEEQTTKPRLVGRIASMPADRKFVLIQSYGTWDVPTGSILTTHGPDGRAANLLATGEKLGQYAAADVKSGILEVGDGVYTIGTQKESNPNPVPELLEPGEEKEEPTPTPPASES